MIGPEFKDTDIWHTKFKDLKNGLYDDKLITILPNTFQPDDSTLPISPPYPPKKNSTGTVK